MFLGQHGYLRQKARELRFQFDPDRIDTPHDRRSDILYHVAYKRQERIQDICPGYFVLSGTGIRKHPVFHGLLLFGDSHHVPVNGGDPSLYIAYMDHADVDAVLSRKDDPQEVIGIDPCLRWLRARFRDLR